MSNSYARHSGSPQPVHAACDLTAASRVGPDITRQQLQRQRYVPRSAVPTHSVQCKLQLGKAAARLSIIGLALICCGTRGLPLCLPSAPPQVVYPLIAEMVDEHLRDHAVDEHDSLKLFSSDLENMKAEDDGFEDKMHQLMEVGCQASVLL